MSTGMFLQVTGWTGCLLLLLLVCRGAVGGMLKRYPLFYGYTIFVIFTSVVALSGVLSRGGYLQYYGNTGGYRQYYWTSELIALCLGFGVTWEIFTQVLAHYPGVRRLAWVLLTGIFVIVVLQSAAGTGAGTFPVAELDRNLRTIQAVVLLTLFGLVRHYSIPIGKNICGIAMGYGFFVATSLLNLSLRFYFGKAFHSVWQLGQPLEYCATAAIWCAMLWSYYPSPAPNDEIERDYQRVSSDAVTAMVRLRSYLLHPDGS